MKISLTVTEIWSENVWKNSLKGHNFDKKGKIILIIYIM